MVGEVLHKLVESAASRVKVVIKAKGRHTVHPQIFIFNKYLKTYIILKWCMCEEVV